MTTMEESPAQSTRPRESVQEKGLPPEVSTPPSVVPSGSRNWNGFLRFVEERNGQSGVKISMLHLTEGKPVGDELVITCKTRTLCSQLTEKQTLSALDGLTREYFGPMVEVRVETGDIAVPKTDRQLQQEAEQHPGVLKIMESFNAQMVSVSSRKQ